MHSVLAALVVCASARDRNRDAIRESKNLLAEDADRVCRLNRNQSRERRRCETGSCWRNIVFVANLCHEFAICALNLQRGSCRVEEDDAEDVDW